VNPRFATVLILCVAEKVLSEPFQGIIRATDVRQTQVDQVEMYKCFRPGDIIRAEVVLDNKSHIESVTIELNKISSLTSLTKLFVCFLILFIVTKTDISRKLAFILSFNSQE
jgi:exosome complex component CSL4